MDGFELNEYLHENKLIIFKNFNIISEEYKVYGSSGQHKNQSWGQIDFIARRKKRAGCLYLIESGLGLRNKWHNFKVLAYRAAYILDNTLYQRQASKVYCVVVMHHDIFTPNLRMIMAYLGISYILLDNQGQVVKEEFFDEQSSRR